MTETAEVVPINISAPPEKPEQDDELRAEYVRAVRAAIDVLNARLLALLALMGALAMWSWCVVDPTVWRFVSCGGYSIGIMWPTIWLHWKRG